MSCGFFFSSRRRHTRCSRDWSSDVCSSDLILGLFSFCGCEVVESTAGEAANPKEAVPKALRSTVATLILFYVAGLALVVGIVPWKQIDMGASPFVRVFQTVGIPAASHIMNFLVLTAALSSAVPNLYFAARLAFSLARAGYLTGTSGRIGRASCRERV